MQQPEHMRPLAHLSIQAAQRAPDAGKLRFPLAQRLLGWALRANQRRPDRPVGVRIDDLQGREFFAMDEIWPRIDVALPAGTYHVRMLHGEQQRLYTVTLEQGATFNLRPRAAIDPA